jgi:hypothetical protein
MHAIDTHYARWCVTVARVGELRRLYGVTLKHNLADNATNDLADALERLSLIAIMAQTAMNRLDGNPGYLWPTTKSTFSI